ncbi:MAG: 16S rRNA (cytosine(1402)-N(4))-methyltransferase RsmH [Desulfovibrio sp.]|nr:16S rRNA (cytosine(1402)-N(4))-methyltransferase RsmH [Desulfovibrio sp.]
MYGFGEASRLHIPVLLAEILEYVQPFPGMRCLDATLGLGGHAEGVMRKAKAAGAHDVRLLGLDRDSQALALAAGRLAPFGDAVRASHRAFSDCAGAVAELGWPGLDFILADIGVSSLQLDAPERGFSFREDGPLDMRMDAGHGKNAAALVNEAPVQALRDIIREYGEEPQAGRIARAIEDARARGRIETTRALAAVVERAYPAKWRAASRNHPATRTFQALRMAVNRELDELKEFLRAAPDLLNPGGRVAVISFHSLEDRMVKHFFRDEATGCRCPRHVPRCVCGRAARLKVLTKKPTGPSEAERAANPRARSAKLRVAERIGHA